MRLLALCVAALLLVSLVFTTVPAFAAPDTASPAPETIASATREAAYRGNFKSKVFHKAELPPCNLQGMHQGFHLGSGSSRGRLPSLQGLPGMLNLLPGRKPSKPSSRQGVQRQGGTETANHSPGRSIAATGCFYERPRAQPSPKYGAAGGMRTYLTGRKKTFRYRRSGVGSSPTPLQPFPFSQESASERTALPLRRRQPSPSSRKAARGIVKANHERPHTPSAARVGVDLVTETDFAIEAFLKERLAVLTPEAAFLAEESAESLDLPPTCWIIDPVDGTTNLAHGLPLTVVSVSLPQGWRAGARHRQRPSARGMLRSRKRQGCVAQRRTHRRLHRRDL